MRHLKDFAVFVMVLATVLYILHATGTRFSSGRQDNPAPASIVSTN